jgi:hypothetical protein
LGAGTKAGEVTGGVVSTSAAVLALAPATGPAAPFVAAAGAIIALISSFIGGGCGNACVEAAQAEQIYEVAADDLLAVAKLGMLSQAEYQAAIQTILQGGQQHMAQLKASGDSKADPTNMTNTINAELADGASLPTAASTAIDLNKAQSVFIDPSTKGWYSASVTAGNQIALAYLQNLQAQNVSQTSGIAVSPTGGVDVLGQSFSFGEIAIGLGLVATVIYFAS